MNSLTFHCIRNHCSVSFCDDNKENLNQLHGLVKTELQWLTMIPEKLRQCWKNTRA